MRLLPRLPALLALVGCARTIQIPNLASAFDAHLTDIDGTP